MKRPKKAKLIIIEKPCIRKHYILVCPHCHIETTYMSGFDENILMYKCIQCKNTIDLRS
jgi:hypothetical protein